VPEPDRIFRASANSWVRTLRAVRWIVALASLCVAGLGTAQTAAASSWRAFSDSSPWNRPAAPASIAASNPYASEFAGSAGFTMKISGTADNPRFGSPVYFAQPGDPLAPVTLGASGWSPRGSLRWDGQPIPAPAGVAPASGSDGHLVVVSADRRTAWEFWRCTAAGPAGYTAEVISQWDLTGPGYAPEGHSNSARASGSPLISTSLRAEEALNGFDHALGITVPSVSSSYEFPPATHSDGSAGAGAIEYGMLFVLRPDYRPPPGAPIGVRNVVRALKAYGAYVVDQGADFEIDADPTHPELWAQTGLAYSPFDFTATDFRPARPGPPGPPPPDDSQAALRARPSRVILRVGRHRVRRGAKLELSGRVVGPNAGTARVRLLIRSRNGAWRTLLRRPVKADGRFATRVRLRVTRHVRAVRLRAAAKRFGRSGAVRVRIAK
jgi:hypothetical protein